MDELTQTLAILRPDEFPAAWRWIELLRRCGELDDDEAPRWKLGLIGLMRFWATEPVETFGQTAIEECVIPLP